MIGVSREGAATRHPATVTPPRQDMGRVHPPGTDEGSSGQLIRIVAALTLAYSVFYIAWRWTATLNPAALWFAIPLALAETYGLATSFFMTLTAWRLKRRSAPPAPPGLSVDVYVTTYNEPLTVIRKTALAARAIRYPHETWILDDGRRDELRTLALELGVGYLRRPNNEHAKAGNLNHALAHTKGDFILQLDADHVPLPTILDKLLGFMTDGRVAFVQSPQDFYNTDAFTYEVNETGRRIWEDQQLFFRVIQPGKDRLGAAFFVGSCAVIRRSALHDIGGFATHTITEDIETSLKLHARGWKSVYYGETLAYGLAPGSAAAFHVQHLRWGQGAMQALRRYKVLTMRGLTPLQRIAYFDSLTTYLGGFQRLIFYAAPPLFFLTGIFPVRANALQFSIIFVPYMLLQMLSFKMLSRGHGSLLLADRYGMVKFFTHIMAITGYFTRGRLRFHVTPKGVTDVPFRTYAPQLAVAVVTTLAVIYAVFSVALGRTSYEVVGWGSFAFWVNLLFALLNTVVAVFIVDMSLKLRQKRQDHRYTETAPVHLTVSREGRGMRDRMIGLTDNLNPAGMAVRTMQRIAHGAWVTVQLPLSTGNVEAKGRVVHHREEDSRFGPVHTHGIEFVDLPWNDRDDIELHCAHHVTPMRRQRYIDHASTWTTTRRWVRDARRAVRTDVGLPARVTEVIDGTHRYIGLGLWEDTSASGARIVIEDPIPMNTLLHVEIPGTAHTVEGIVVFVRPLETSVGTRFLIGLRSGSTRPLPTAAAAAVALPSAEPAVPAVAPIEVAHAEPAEMAETPSEESVMSDVYLEPAPQEEPVINEVLEHRQSTTPEAEPALSIWGGGARMNGRFDIDDSIEIRCEVSGEVHVGGRLVIEEGGVLQATVRTNEAVIRGVYDGDMVASGAIHIASTGRVSGRLQTDELIIDRGGSFKGSVQSSTDEAEAANEAETPARSSQVRAKVENGRSSVEAPRAETVMPSRAVRIESDA